MTHPPDALAAAVMAREELFSRAARGEPVTAADLRAADEAVTAAETDTRLADAIGTHRRRQLELAAIEQMHRDADDLRARFAELDAARLRAAAEVDAALAEAREAAARLADAEQALSAVTTEAHAFDLHADATAGPNRALGAMHPSQRPKARLPQLGVPVPLRIEIVQTRRGYRAETNAAYDAVLFGTAAGHAAKLLHGVTGLPAAA